MNRPPDPAQKGVQKPLVRIDNFVRKQTQEVDLETLGKKGVTRLNFITFQKINDLVSLAVKRAFEKYERIPNAPEPRKVQAEAEAEVVERLAAGVVGNGAFAEERERELEQEAEALERRLSSLRRHLAEVREDLQRLSGENGSAPLEGRFLRKREMLRTIFEENLQLQKAGRS